MSSYRDYCNTEKEAGRKPASMKEWAAARDPQPGPNDHDSDPEDRSAPDFDAAAVAAAKAEAEPEPDLYVRPSATPAETAEERVKRLRYELAQAEVEISMVPKEDLRAKAEAEARESGRWVFHSENRLGAIVLQSIPPTTVNGHYVPGRHQFADFSNHRWMTENPDLAESLIASEAYRKGEVYLVPEGVMAPPPTVRVVDGPRTTQSIAQRARPAERPRGPLSTTVR